MDFRDDDRKREKWVAQRIAEELNHTQGLDYVWDSPVGPCEDASLVSASGNHPRRSVEMVRAPISGDVWRESRTSRALDTKLKEHLAREGVCDGNFHLCWSSEIVTSTSKTKEKVVAAMASVIARLCRDFDGLRTISAEDVYEESPIAASGFHYVRILRTPEYREFWVASSTGTWVPRDGTWIREAVAKKAAHQVDILVVDGGRCSTTSRLQHSQRASIQLGTASRGSGCSMV
jgi:hypothetical protein